MKTFNVTIRYTGEKTYTVEAIDAEHAEKRVWDMYDHADLEGGSDVVSVEDDITGEQV